MKADAKQLLATTGGALAAGIAIKKVSSPITPIALLALGVGLSLKAKGEYKDLGNGIAAIGAIGTLSKVAEKVDALQKFAPTISGVDGMGELYEDEDGNIINMDGLNGPQLVQDEYGNTFMVEGVDGLDGEDDVYYDDEDGVYDDDDGVVEGIYGTTDLEDVV